MRGPSISTALSDPAILLVSVYSEYSPYSSYSSYSSYSGVSSPVGGNCGEELRETRHCQFGDFFGTLKPGKKLALIHAIRRVGHEAKERKKSI